MPRKRKRDWPQTVYKYWARPLGDPPQALWDQAKKMQALWNTLVVARERIGEELKDADDATKKEGWLLWRTQSRTYVADSGLNWECGPAVLDRFEAACRRAAKEGKGWPKLHHKLTRINIPHRFTGGGASIESLFSSTAKRFRLLDLPADGFTDNTRASRRNRHTTGTFGLAGASMRFETILHRQLPAQGIVKSVSWVGSRHPVKGWQWSITVTLEVPHPPARFGERICGLDLGWRVREGGLRIGMVVEPDGTSQELILPFASGETARTRRHWRTDAERPYLHTLQDVFQLDSEIGNAVETIKAQLKELLPAEKRRGLVQMRQGGLIRLRRTLEEEGGFPDAVDALLAWQKDNDYFRRLRANVEDKLVNHRRHLYRNLAAWLTKTYDVIVWEGDLDIKAMAEQKDKEYALSAADRYRQYAAIGELQLYIQQAVAKNNARLVDKQSAYSTQTCNVCGALAQPGAPLYLECQNGHRWDQDVNAGKNLVFSQTS